MTDGAGDDGDLVATAQGPQLEDGIAVLDAGRSSLEAAARGDWAEAGLNAGIAGLDTLGAVIDPFGVVLASGFAWLMEHVWPMDEMLDSVAGDAARIQATAQTWVNVAHRLAETAEDTRHHVQRDLHGMTGPALALYRARAEHERELLDGLASSVRALGDGVATAGSVVGAVRSVVRDLVSAALAKMVTVAARAAATLGLATPWVVADITATVSRYTARIADWLTSLVRSVERLSELLSSVRGRLDELVDVLARVRAWADETGVARSPVFDDGWAGKPRLTMRTAEDGLVPGNVASADFVRVDADQYRRFTGVVTGKSGVASAAKADDRVDDPQDE